MAKDPAFLFYPGDWMGGTQWMTMEQKGCYMELLILQFNTGGFTEAQAKQVLSICFDVAWPMLKQKFKFEAGIYRNERLDEEVIKRKNFTESRRINGLNPKQPPKKRKAYAKHMEDRNENENKDDKEKGVQGEKHEMMILLDPFSPGFQIHWDNWIKFKSDELNFKYKKKETEQTAFNELLKLSGNNEKIAEQIIQRSIANRWKGLFQLDEKQNGNTKKSGNYIGGLSESSIRNTLNRPPISFD